MTHRPRHAVVVLAATCVLVPITATASASDDEHVTWDQVRAGLVAAHRLPNPHRPPPPTDGPGAATVSVTIPDLSWAIDDPTAPAGVRRAACHQVTGQDDESAAPLATCLAHVNERPGPPSR